MAQDKKTQIFGSSNIYADAMRKLINNKQFSDVQFRVGKGALDEDGKAGDSERVQTIYAHRGILAAHCEVFREMFLDEDYKDSNQALPLTDMSPHIFLAMMEYMYTNSITLDSTNAIDVLASALEYGLDDLREMCVHFVVTNLNIANACDVMQTAVTYNQNDLRQMAMDFIEKNTKDVLLSESFTHLSQDALVSILQSSKLLVDELDIISAVRAWAGKYCLHVEGQEITEVGREAIKQLRLPLLSSEELDLLEADNKDSFLPANLFLEARALHQHKQEGNILCTKREGTKQRVHLSFKTEH